MSSDLALPTIPELLAAFGAEVTARRAIADVHDGSLYDIAAGIGAILWARMAGRDQDLFRVCYFDSATDSDLEERIQAFGGAARVTSSRGTGTAVIRRSTTAGGSGTLWAGTRIAVTGVGSLKPRMYRISQDTAMGAVLSATITVEAEEAGTGASINTSQLSTPRLVWADEVWDSTWTIDSLTCADGTDRETDPVYLARYRQDKIDRRRGYAKAITDACLEAGASHVALFESDFIPPDTGINRCFVGDAAFESTHYLINACRAAVDSARVAGCDLTVFGMTKSLCSFDLTLRMWDDPGAYNQDKIRIEATRAVQRYFGGQSNPYVYRFDGVRGELARSIPDLQDVIVNSGPSDTSISSILDGASLPHLYTSANAISITLQGPQ